MKVLFSIFITIIFSSCSKSNNNSATNTPVTPVTNPFNATGTFTFSVNGVSTFMTIQSYYLLQDKSTIVFNGGNTFTGYTTNCVIKMPTENKVTLGQYSSAQNLSSFGYKHDYVSNGISYVNEWNSSTTSVVNFKVVSYDASNHYNLQLTFSGTVTDAFNNSLSITNGIINAQLW